MARARSGYGASGIERGGGTGGERERNMPQGQPSPKQFLLYSLPGRKRAWIRPTNCSNFIYRIVSNLIDIFSRYPHGHVCDYILYYFKLSPIPFSFYVRLINFTIGKIRLYPILFIFVYEKEYQSSYWRDISTNTNVLIAFFLFFALPSVRSFRRFFLTRN